MQVAEPKTRRWTRDEYYQMSDLGLFQDQRIELIGGEIIEVSPQRSFHSLVIGLVEEQVRRLFGKAFWIRTQMPLHVSEDSEPEPDIAVVSGSPRDYRDDHPTSAILVVEVSDTTLTFDSGRKASLYASAGIADYWIVNLVNDRLEIRREPVSDPAAPFGYRYADMKTLGRGDSATTLARPEVPIAVSDLLP